MAPYHEHPSPGGTVRRRTAIRELQALNDHYLTDIGLERSRIVATLEKITETGGKPA